MFRRDDRAERANAARIVACVNALAGLPNPSAVADVIEATRIVDGYLSVMDPDDNDNLPFDVASLRRAWIETGVRALIALDATDAQ